MADSNTLSAGVLPGRSRFRFLRIGFLAIVLLSIAAVALLAILARPTSLGAVRTAVGEGLEESVQLWRGLTFWPSAPYPESEVIEGLRARLVHPLPPRRRQRRLGHHLGG